MITKPKSNIHKTIIIIQCRMNSSRLPGKALLKIGSIPSILFMINRVKKVKESKEIWIAISKNKSDDKLYNILKKEKKINIFRGDEEDVLSRFNDISKKTNPKNIVRLTGDCPFIDPALIDFAIRKFLNSKYDYLSNHLERTYPDGQDIEIFSAKALYETSLNATDPYHRLHVTPYMHGKRKDLSKGNFKKESFKNKIDWSHIRMTLDQKDDLFVLNELSLKMGKNFSWLEAVSEITKEPNLLSILRQYNINEGSNNDFKNFRFKEKIFEKSNTRFNLVKEKIPVASQTFSKSYMQWVKGSTPLFLSKGEGCKVTDIDNNNYIDYVLGLMPIILGYVDKDINDAIERQMKNGITFSLPTLLEEELADILIENIPCAEMVRFGKNGSDVTAAAIRLSRAYTNREIIVMMGYHGWHDWSIGTSSRDLGVPKSIANLTIKTTFNNLDEFKKIINQYSSKIAAVILEPDSIIQPNKDFLKNVKEITKKNGSLLIFDEVISGFRTHVGGAQKYYGVEPDLACFGKAMANGMPLSAIVGKKQIMSIMNEIFFSGTFGGETLSLVASIATIKKIKLLDVPNRLWKLGDKLRDELNLLIKEKDLIDFFNFEGAGWWPRINFKESTDINKNLFISLFRQSMVKESLLIASSINLCLAHEKNEIFEQTLEYFNKGLEHLVRDVLSKKPSSRLNGDLIRPIFKVR